MGLTPAQTGVIGIRIRIVGVEARGVEARAADVHAAGVSGAHRQGVAAAAEQTRMARGAGVRRVRLPQWVEPVRGGE